MNKLIDEHDDSWFYDNEELEGCDNIVEDPFQITEEDDKYWEEDLEE